MKATKRQFYGGKVLEAGEKFDAASEGDAKVLSIVGNAERDVDETPTRAYRRRDMQAEH